jgi:hypothetical protein
MSSAAAQGRFTEYAMYFTMLNGERFSTFRVFTINGDVYKAFCKKKVLLRKRKTTAIEIILARRGNRKLRKQNSCNGIL